MFIVKAIIIRKYFSGQTDPSFFTKEYFKAIALYPLLVFK